MQCLKVSPLNHSFKALVSLVTSQENITIESKGNLELDCCRRTLNPNKGIHKDKGTIYKELDIRGMEQVNPSLVFLEISKLHLEDNKL